MSKKNVELAAPAIARPATHAHARVWTAIELFGALAPYRFSRLVNPAAALAPDVRRAHAIAVSRGYNWDPDGRYPISVWIEVFA